MPSFLYEKSAKFRKQSGKERPHIREQPIKGAP